MLHIVNIVVQTMFIVWSIYADQEKLFFIQRG